MIEIPTVTLVFLILAVISFGISSTICLLKKKKKVDMSIHLKILNELQKLRDNESLSKEFCAKINLEQRLFDRIMFSFNNDYLEVGFIMGRGYDVINIKVFPFEEIVDFLLETNPSFFNVLFNKDVKYTKDELKIIFKNM